MTSEEIVKELRAGPLSGNPVFEEAADMLLALKARAEAAEKEAAAWRNAYAIARAALEAKL